MYANYRKIITVLVVSIVIGFSCVIMIGADYHGIVHSKSGNSFYIAPLHMDPEVDYIFPKVYMTEETKIHGKKELKDGQEIKVWIEQEKNKIIARRIKIITRDTR